MKRIVLSLLVLGLCAAPARAISFDDSGGTPLSPVQEQVLEQFLTFLTTSTTGFFFVSGSSLTIVQSDGLGDMTKAEYDADDDSAADLADALKYMVALGTGTTGSLAPTRLSAGQTPNDVIVSSVAGETVGLAQLTQQVRDALANGGFSGSTGTLTNILINDTTIYLGAPPDDATPRVPILTNTVIEWQAAILDAAQLGADQTFTGANSFTGTAAFSGELDPPTAVDCSAVAGVCWSGSYLYVDGTLVGDGVGGGGFPISDGSQTLYAVQTLAAGGGIELKWVNNFPSSTLSIIGPPDGTDLSDNIRLRLPLTHPSAGDNLKVLTDDGEQAQMGWGAPHATTKTKAQLAATTPSVAGDLYYCSNCSTDSVVVSTGTAQGAFAGLVTNRSTAPN